MIVQRGYLMLFDYTTLQLIWWAIIVFILILYATTAGCDFGVTIMMPFMTRHKNFKDNDIERRLALNTIAPTWDGNQTWIIIAGGALFGIWPAVYGTVFSGLYPALLLVLFTLFLRPPGFDYRSKLEGDGWRKFWDWGLFISSFIPLIIFGLVLGSLFYGLPFYHDDFMMRSVYIGNAFASVLSPFAVLVALLVLSMSLTHGCLHLNRRLDGELGCYFRRLANIFILSSLILMTLGFFMLLWVLPGMIVIQMPQTLTYNTQVSLITGGWMNNYTLHTWMWLVPVICYVMLILAWLLKGKNAALAYWCSALSIAAVMYAGAFALFPFVVPSSWVGNAGLGSQSLTIWNVSSSPYSLMGMFYITVVSMILIISYKFWGFRVAWRNKAKLDKDTLKNNEHTFY